jgi:hypothetical protein
MATEVPRMTPQTEGRIVRAVEDVIDLIDAGDHPNDAIAKTAADLQLPVGHVGLLINAYNTGRTNRQRASSPLLAEKAADFPLAEPGEILERLWPATVKSAAQVQLEGSVSPDYDLPPTWLERARNQARLVKQAEAAPRSAPAAAPYPADPAARVKRAYHAAVARDRETEEARRAFSAAQDRLIAGFQKLAAWFGNPGNEAIADVRAAVEARWGRPGAAILDHLAGTRPALVKRAALHGGRLVPVDHGREPYRTIVDTIGRTEEVRPHFGAPPSPCVCGPAGPATTSRGWPRPTRPRRRRNSPLSPRPAGSRRWDSPRSVLRASRSRRAPTRPHWGSS